MIEGPIAAAGDDETRRLIREDLDSTMMVEAGAGTGKTRALVERVVWLVMAGRRIERIAAITFTEKAATELKDRVRFGLETALSEYGAKQDLIEEALASLDRAQISTIHSFGQALLRAFAPEAGIDPSFAIVDEVAAERRFRERWRIYLDSLASDESAGRVVDRAMGLGMTPADFEDLAKDLAEKAELAPFFANNALRPPAVIWPDLDVLLARLEALRIDGVEGSDRLRAKVAKLITVVRFLAGAGNDKEGFAALTLPREMKVGVGNAENWGGAARINDARDTAAEVFSALDDTLAACREEALAAVMPLIARFVREDATDRGRMGELTFSDLILRTRDLLAANREAVTSLRDRYDALLIDEFQDTDPLQVEIALLFARYPGSDRLEPGRLFLVGDPKQSIYRFRRADMGIYSHVKDLIGVADGLTPVLGSNHRSQPEVIGWVNRVFQQLIGHGDTPAVQPAYLAIHPLRGDDLAGPAVGRFGAAITDGRNAREVRLAEAADAAALCRTAVSGGWDVFDQTSGAVRPAAYRDIALLMPTRGILVALERALAAEGVPYRVEGGSLVYRTQEVRDVINLLTAVDDPADEVAVVAALRSPAFACSDVELAEHRMGGGSFDYLRNRSGAVARVSDALAELKKYHEERYRTSLAAFVERIVAERGLVETGILFHGDRNSFRRMRFVVEQARTFESAGRESLRQFVLWLEQRGLREILDNEGAGLDDDEDAVRLMTIHAAKGLEFPIVLMVGMAHAPRDDRRTYLSDVATETVAVSIGLKGRRFQVGPYEELRLAESQHTNAEFSRTLYVAATRARDHLVFSLYRKGEGANSAAGRIESAGGAEGVPSIASRTAESLSTAPFADLQIDEPTERTVGAFESARLALVGAARGRQFTSATAEVRKGGEPAPEKRDEEDPAEPWARGRGGTRLGRAVHAAIQSLPLDADDSLIAAFSRAQAVAEAIPQRESDVRHLVRQALSSEAAGRARTAARALREVPFAIQSGDVTLEGYADMVIETAEGLEIVDWKTDQISPDQIERRLEDYRLQAGLYAWGLSRATGRHVHRVTYVFVSAGREVSPGEPGALAEMAERHLATRTAAPSS
jgi:ATP-dependent helicase/nuclease subunit A